MHGRYVRCFNARDREGMLSLLADDCAYSSLAYWGSYAGKQVPCSLSNL